jgi:hypothetical protein
VGVVVKWWRLNAGPRNVADDESSAPLVTLVFLPAHSMAVQKTSLSTSKAPPLSVRFARNPRWSTGLEGDRFLAAPGIWDGMGLVSGRLEIREDQHRWAGDRKDKGPGG